MNRKHVLLGVVVALYLATWVGGWISHARDLQTRAEGWYDTRVLRNQQQYAEGEVIPISDRVREGGPHTTVYWCVPLVPGLLLARSDVVIGPLAASGEYEVVLWYGVGSVELFTVLAWIA